MVARYSHTGRGTARVGNQRPRLSDPHATCAGRNPFSAHIGQFQTDMPGTDCEILNVKAQHSKTVVHRQMFGADGQAIMQGTSFAILSDDGKLTSFAYFSKTPKPQLKFVTFLLTELDDLTPLSVRGFLAVGNCTPTKLNLQS